MRRMLAVVALIAGCSEPVQGPKGDKGEPGTSADPAVIAAMQAQIDALSAKVAEQASALAVVKPATLPHLYVKATGEDLGVSPMPGVVFSPSDRHYVERLASSARLVLFSGTDCTGDAMLDRNFRPPVGVMFPDSRGRLYVGLSDEIASINYQSHLNRDSRCEDEGSMVSTNGFTIRATGATVQLFAPSELELR